MEIVKTSLYLPLDLKKKVEIHCINQEIPRANNFYVEAIREKIEREEAKKRV